MDLACVYSSKCQMKVKWAYENLRNQGITIPDERKKSKSKPEIPTLYYWE